MYRLGGSANDGHLAVKIAEQEVAIHALQDENMLLSKRVKELEENRCQMKAQLERQGR